MLRRRASRVFALAAAILGMALGSPADEPKVSPSDLSAMKAVVTEYISGYNAMDTRRTSATLSGYMQPDQFEKGQAGYFATLKKTEYRNVRLSEPMLEPNGSNYEIEVKAELFEETLQQKQPRLIPSDTIYQLVQEHSQWKILTFFAAAERVATAILGQLTGEERQEYLQKNHDRLNLDVVMAITNRADQPGMDDPARILDVAMDVAKVVHTI